MTDFLVNLPAPSSDPIRSSDSSIASYTLQSSSTINKYNNTNNKLATNPSHPPPPRYLHRGRFIPRTEEDFSGGGAYPEIHVAQFPLGMGKTTKIAGSTIPLQIGADGRLAYDAVVKQGAETQVVYTHPESAEGIGGRGAGGKDGSNKDKPGTDEELKEAERVKAAIGKVLEAKCAAGKVKKQQKGETEFVRYTPAKQSEEHNSGAAQRIIRMEDIQSDPMEPPRFKHKRVPASRFSPPPPVLHSPTRKLTQQDQQEWKIPPSVSNWKNQKGYTIPLDKRIAADGRNLQDISINDKFASLSEALYIAERQAREEIKLRNEIKKQKKMREEEIREQQLRQLAAQARAERAQLLQQPKKGEGDDAERQQREEMTKEREREIEREVRLERNKKKRRDDSQRDISELVALGLPVDKKQRGDALFDTRLFNQQAGVDSGYKGGADDTYNLYDKPLFASRAAGMYQFSRDRLLESVGETDGVAAFAGADKTKYTRTAPVEFDKDVSDPFGLDNLLSEAKKK